MIEFNNKKKLILAISIYCSLLLGIIIIGQYDKLSVIFSSILTVLSPLIIGFTLAYLLNPILNFFEKNIFKFIKNKKALRFIGISCTYIALFLFVGGFGMLVIPQVTKSISELVGKFEQYKGTLLQTVNELLQKLKDIEILHEDVDASTIIEKISANFSSGTSILKKILSYLANNIDAFLTVPKNILLGIFISLYTLLTKERLAAQIKKLGKGVLSPTAFENIHHRITFTHSTFGGYFTGVVIDALLVGITTFLALVVFNVPYPSLVAVIVAITNVIPIFGPFLGAIPSALIIFISEPEKVIIFIIIILLIQQIDGNIIAPRILGNSTGMSSLSVIIAITVMGACFGFMGMFIGVPIFAVIIALIKEIVEERLRSKDLPVETANYYPRNSLADAPGERTTLFDRLRKAVTTVITKIFKKEEK